MPQSVVSGPTVTVVAELVERCDRCGAAGKVRAVVAGGELTFCGHHANQFAEGVYASAERVAVASGFEWRI
jgi:hypothetical protein